MDKLIPEGVEDMLIQPQQNSCVTVATFKDEPSPINKAQDNGVIEISFSSLTLPQFLLVSNALLAQFNSTCKVLCEELPQTMAYDKWDALLHHFVLMWMQEANDLWVRSKQEE